MTASQGEPTTTEEHAAPPEAWDAIAVGYDRYVAPQEVDLANEALRLVGLAPGEGSSTSRRGRAVSACRPHAWARRCSPPTGQRR